MIQKSASSAESREGMTMDEQPAKSETGPEPREAAPKPAPQPVPKPLPPPPPLRAKRRGKTAIIAGLAGVIVVVAVVIYYLHFIAPYESTDDAFIEGRVTTVSPRVPGLVVKLLVDDNQRVKEGDPLVELDAADYNARAEQARADLATARAQLEQARAQITVDEAKAEQQQAAVTAAEAESVRADADLKRYESVEVRAVSRSQLDLAQAQARSTAANVEVTRSQAKAATAQVAFSRVSVEAAAARVKQAQAQLDLAELNLSYTRVTAPINGRVTMRSVEQGINVQAGQALLTLVPEEVWVVANFKESQLKLMRPRQPVTLRVDAYPSHKFKGHVDSIQSGTGARFSLLPPENAVGNYVKVVQRVPVKIVLEETPDPQLDLAPGMSVVPKVKVK